MLIAAKYIGAGLTCAGLIGSNGEFIIAPFIISCGEIIVNTPVLISCCLPEVRREIINNLSHALISCGEIVLNSPILPAGGCGVIILPLTLIYGVSEEFLNALKNAGKLVGVAVVSGTAVATSNALASDQIRQYRENQAKEAAAKALEEQTKQAKAKSEAIQKQLSDLKTENARKEALLKQLEEMQKPK